MITRRLKKRATSTTSRTLVKKVITQLRPLTLSRHPSHDILRTGLKLQPFRSLIRLGSTTTKEQAYQHRRVPLTASQLANIIEINSVQGVRNSASKLLMKQCFSNANVATAEWFTWSVNQGIFVEKTTDTGIEMSQLPFPIVAKSHFGSRGNGNTKLDNLQELQQWMIGKTLSNYIYEAFKKYSREYRLHVTEDGCFYTCRKLVRNDAPADTWQRHDDVCVWILETNPSFKKPNNWDAIVADCIRAKNALGLDICAFDVMVQGSREGRERNNPEWIICESCSAPSFGEITGQKYIEQINRLLVQKYNNR